MLSGVTRHGVQLDPESGQIRFVKGGSSNVCLEFLHASNPDPNSGHVASGGRAGWALYHPGKGQHYVLETKQSDSKGVGNYVLGRPYSTGAKPSSTFSMTYGGAPEFAIQEAIKEEQEVVEAIEKTAKAVALADKTLKQKKIVEEVAAADHQNKVLGLRQKCFPKWESEKALRLRLASMSQGGQAVKIKSDTEALENAMIAGLEIFLSYGVGLVDYAAADDLLVKEWKVPPGQLEALNGHYSEYGLKTRPEFGKDSIIHMPGVQ